MAPPQAVWGLVIKIICEGIKVKVDLVFTAGAIVPAELAGRTAVVFDVLRATSTIVTALANGCRAVVPVVDVDEARRVAERLVRTAAAGESRPMAGQPVQTGRNAGSGNPGSPGDAASRGNPGSPGNASRGNPGSPGKATYSGEEATPAGLPPFPASHADGRVISGPAAAAERPFVAADGPESHGVLLAGERDGAKLPGFPHGNSPLEYGPEVSAGKTLVLTTTNGTRAIHGAAPAAAIYAGSLLNARAAAAAVLDAGRDVTLLCAGTRERFSLEDTAAAGFVLMELLALAGADATGPVCQAACGDAAAGPAGQAPSQTRSSAGPSRQAPSGSSRRAPAAGREMAGHSGMSPLAGNGTGGSFPIEAAAGKNNHGSTVRLELTDPALAALHLARAYRQNPLQIMYDSRHGQKLLGMGLAADLAWCARVNALDVVPVYRDGRLVL